MLRKSAAGFIPGALFWAFCCAGCFWSPMTKPTVQEYTYSDSEPYIKVSPTDIQVKLSGVQGKTLSYIAVNNSSDIITVRRILDMTADGKSALTAEDGFKFSGQDNMPSAREEKFDFPKTRHFEDPGRKLRPDSFASVNRSARALTDFSDEPGAGYSDSDFKVKETKRDFYVLFDKDLSDYTKKLSFTLRAKGYKDGSTNGSREDLVCYVWVADDNYDEKDARGKIINQRMAEDIAGKFGRYKDAETSLVGKESDNMIYFISGSIWSHGVPLSSFSPTGTVVNIMVYDIGNDFEESSGGETGVVGFFTAKDYWYLKNTENLSSSQDVIDFYKSSNKGKYFYIDSGWCNYNSRLSGESGPMWRGNTDVSGTVISTLFHEFQHMINYGSKVVDSTRRQSSSAWFDEMCSMLVEDAMQTVLEYDAEEAPDAVRLPYFNRYYYILGADYWYKNEYQILSYSSSYSFGAYITRNYGGAGLLSHLVENDTVDWDSVTDAIKTVTGKSVTDESLVRDWAMACSFRPGYAEKMRLPTFYKTPEDYTAYEYTYSLKPINLFGADYSFTVEKYDGTTFYGPSIYKPQEVRLYPHGFCHFGLGTVPDDAKTVTVNLSSYLSDGQIYILVHDEAPSSSREERIQKR